MPRNLTSDATAQDIINAIEDIDANYQQQDYFEALNNITMLVNIRFNNVSQEELRVLYFPLMILQVKIYLAQENHPKALEALQLATEINASLDAQSNFDVTNTAAELQFYTDITSKIPQFEMLAPSEKELIIAVATNNKMQIAVTTQKMLAIEPTDAFALAASTILLTQLDKALRVAIVNKNKFLLINTVKQILLIAPTHALALSKRALLLTAIEDQLLQKKLQAKSDSDNRPSTLHAITYDIKILLFLDPTNASALAHKDWLTDFAELIFLPCKKSLLPPNNNLAASASMQLRLTKRSLDAVNQSGPSNKKTSY